MFTRDSNTDPFNAGEPTLPWQDPDSEAYDVAGEPYEAPRYNGGDPEAAPRPPATHQAPSRRRAGRGRTRSADVQRRETGRRAEQQARTTGRIASIFRTALGAFFVVWMIVLGLFLMSEFMGCTAGPSATGTRPVETDPPTYEEPSYVGSDPDEAEDQCQQIAQARLDSLVAVDTPDHAAAASRIAAAFAQQVEHDFDRTVEELGLDPATVAEWVIASLTYEVTSAYAFPQADQPHASVYFDTESYSMMTMYFTFLETARTYLLDQGLTLASGGQDRALDKTQKIELARQLQAAMDQAGAREVAMCVRFTVENDAWTVDEQELERYCGYVFGLPASMT